MAGWRGASGSSIPLTRHGSGGMFSGQLSGTLATQNAETGQPNVSNIATLPTRGAVVVPAFHPPSNIPGAKYGVPGRVVTNNVSGDNPNVATQEAVASGGPGANPLAGSESSLARVQPDSAHGHNPAQTDSGQVKVPNVGHEIGWRGGLQIANDKLWATDRHGIMNTGTERGGGRRSGETDPPMDGPPRPSLRLVQRTINWMVGNPLAAQDHEPGEQRNYSMVAGVPAFSQSSRIGQMPCLPSTRQVSEPGPQFIGEQGTGWAPVYGGVPQLYQPYGSYAGYTAGPVKGIQSPAEQGSAGDGPQKVFSGVPHGLHTQTSPDYSSTLGRYMAIPQMSLPRQDRPSNSTSAGQSYNQTVVPQGQTGTVGVQSSTGGATPGATASQAWRGRQSKGWRGIRPGGGQT